MLDADDVRKPKPPFGRWLIEQADRTDAVGALANAARQDRHFPSQGDPKDASLYLNRCGAEPEMHHALEEAELDWNCY